MILKIIFISLIVLILIIFFVIFLDEARYSEGVGGKIFFIIFPKNPVLAKKEKIIKKEFNKNNTKTVFLKTLSSLL
ncbi:MAG: hypothetical protein HXM07_07345 [Fusobacterium periodonticum]|nr:hypothetical protein [Fusobacterium periodonticum]